MFWLKRIALGVVVLLVLALIAPWFIPLRSYIPLLEKRASAELKQPVKIGDLALSLLPLPAVTIKQLSIGTTPVRIESVTIKPELFSLFSEPRVLREVEISGVALNDALIAMVGVLASRQGSGGPAPIKINRIHLEQMTLNLDSLKWGPLFADVRLGEAGPETIEAGTADKHFKLAMTPGGDLHYLQVVASKWVLPLTAAPLKLDTLHIAGEWQGKQLKLSSIDGKLYGGTFKGDTRADWEKGWHVGGHAALNEVEVQDIVAQLSPNTRVSGRLTANGRYSMVSRDASKLSDALNATFPFQVRHGVLHGFDLETAVRSLASQGTRGGQTRFDELSGVLQVNGKHYRFRNLRVSSGVLRATGEVSIAANQQLSGTMNVEMKGTSSLLVIPVDLSGTLSAPVIYPNKAALAGAAAGTAILGPGVGTGVGSKAGQMLEKWLK